MALLRYFKPLQTTDSFPDCKSCLSLSEKELKSANQMLLNIWPLARTEQILNKVTKDIRLRSVHRSESIWAVMIQVIWLHFIRKTEQVADIFLGRWPTVFCIYTYRRVRRSPSNCLVHTHTAVAVQSAVSIHSNRYGGHRHSFVHVPQTVPCWVCSTYKNSLTMREWSCPYSRVHVLGVSGFSPKQNLPI